MGAKLQPASEQTTRSMINAYDNWSERYASVIDPVLKPVVKEVYRLASMKEGDAVLDLATGSGAFAEVAANGKNSVTGVDNSPGMIAAARRLRGDLAEFVVADAASLPFDIGSFDVVVCGLGLAHFNNADVVLKETLRVLQLHGRFVATAWGTNSRDLSFSSAIEIIKHHAKICGVNQVASIDEKTWADCESGCEIIRLAGFSSVKAKTGLLSGNYSSVKAAVDWALSWPLVADIFYRFDSSEREVLFDRITGAVEEAGDLSYHRDVNYYTAAKS